MPDALTWSTWLLSGLLVALQIPDIVTTNRILAVGGRELNPVIRLCLRLGRLWWLPKLGLALAGAAIFALNVDWFSFWCLVGLDVLYVGVVVSNMRQLSKRRRRLAR